MPSYIRGSDNFDSASFDDTLPVAKAWVNFNGSGTVAIRASYNVSSITDNGTGDYSINFTNTLTDEKFAAAGSSDGSTVVVTYSLASRTSGRWRILTLTTTTSGNIDGTDISAIIFR
jgi:hypothetical protein